MQDRERGNIWNVATLLFTLMNNFIPLATLNAIHTVCLLLAGKRQISSLLGSSVIRHPDEVLRDIYHSRGSHHQLEGEG